MTNRKIQYWVIPPVLCMDEQPVQLIKDVKQPIAATKKHAKRVDYEYERAGVANVFMFAKPLSGWREVAIRDRDGKATRRPIRQVRKNIACL